ncbi:integrase catalytic domain-containing protein [Trichonephila clavipes]|nr:integrase catalytic domain-containing protein [Trichonephila clavipes]
MESILNSRPLTPLSSDPNNFAVPTPEHFLTCRPLQSLLEPDLTDKLDNRLSQWQKLTKFVQFIWRKWRLDYLNNLQARYKWQFQKENATPNSMVILKDENLPPCKWTMGRVLEIVKGSDGKVKSCYC